jgi:hypothetical protein
MTALLSMLFAAYLTLTTGLMIAYMLYCVSGDDKDEGWDWRFAGCLLIWPISLPIAAILTKKTQVHDDQQ